MSTSPASVTLVVITCWKPKAQCLILPVKNTLLYGVPAYFWWSYASLPSVLAFVMAHGGSAASPWEQMDETGRKAAELLERHEELRRTTLDETRVRCQYEVIILRIWLCYATHCLILYLKWLREQGVNMSFMSLHAHCCLYCIMFIWISVCYIWTDCCYFSLWKRCCGQMEFCGRCLCVIFSWILTMFLWRLAYSSREQQSM